MYKLSQKLADIIHHDYQLLPVLNRFGIRLGFGDQSVEDICKSHHINPEFLIEILNTYHDPDYFPRQRFLDFPLPLIVEYLKKTHKYYYTFYIPEIERQLNELIASAPGDNNLTLLTRFYLKFKQELDEHLSYEDKNTFPYVLNLHQRYTGEIASDTAATKPLKDFEEFEESHSEVDSKLLDFKNIIIKYLHADYDDNKCNALIATLFNFEDDLRDHARIEEKIMMTKVMQIEKLVFES